MNWRKSLITLSKIMWQLCQPKDFVKFFTLIEEVKLK